jgi:hypothetical protein
VNPLHYLLASVAQVYNPLQQTQFCMETEHLLLVCQTHQQQDKFFNIAQTELNSAVLMEARSKYLSYFIDGDL